MYINCDFHYHTEILLLAGYFILIAAVFDFIDGMVARITEQHF